LEAKLKQLAIINLLLLFISIPSIAQEQSDNFESRVFYHENDSIKYALFIPEQVDTTNELFPLVFIIGGSGSVGNDDYLVLGEPFSNDLAQKENPSFVLTAQIPNQNLSLGIYIDNYWAPTISLILDLLVEELSIDTTRLYITGASLGSMITWGFIYWSETERFAAVIPICGGPPPLERDPVITDIPIWSFCGVSDDAIDDMRSMISEVENAGNSFERIYSTYGNIGFTVDEIDLLNSQNRRHIYTEFTDGGHEIWDKTYDDPALHYWLFSQVKSNRIQIEEEWRVYNASNSGLPANSITDIVIDEQNIKWIGTTQGLIKFDDSEWHVFNTSNSNLPINDIRHIAIEEPGIIWMASYRTDFNPGLVRFDGSNWEVINLANFGLSNAISCLEVDNNGTKWFGTVSFDNGPQHEGLVSFNDNEITVFDTLNSEIPSNNVHCIEVDKYNNKWIGTCIQSWSIVAGKGVAKFDGSDWTIYNTDNSVLPNNSIADIAVDKDNTKWIICSSSGSEHGIVKFDNSEWMHYPEFIDHADDYACLVIDDVGNKYIGLNDYVGPTDIGILKYDNSKWEAFSISNSELPSNQVRCIAVDKYNNKWIGTSAGLAVYNENGIVTTVNEELKTVNSFSNKYSLSQNYPNPFNPSTTIKYSIPKDEKSKTKKVKLIVYDLLGREVTTLVNKEQSEGNYEVEFSANGGSGSDGDGSSVSRRITSGIYFYRLQAGDYVETKKMILLK
jgi:hypothetical protein